MSLAIYLTGSVFEPGVAADGLCEPDWRSLAMSRLQRHGISVVNPLDLIFAHGNEISTAEPTVRKALDLIDQCDAVLANLTKPNYGSAMEIFYAHRQGKAVTVVGSSPFSPWVLSHSKARFQSIDPAIDYLIGEPLKIDPVAWCLQYEHSLSNHYEQFPLSGELDYQFLGGEIPVLVVAPHATAFFREGDFQEPEVFTGAITSFLNKTSRCHSLSSSYCLAADPYWHLETPLRKTFSSIIEAGKVRLVIFLLGAPWQRTPGIRIRICSSGPHHIEDYGAILRYRLSALEPVPEQCPEETQEPLLSFSVNKLKVPAIELRLHKHYRMPRLEPQPFRQMVGILSDFVATAGKELERGH